MTRPVRTLLAVVAALLVALAAAAVPASSSSAAPAGAERTVAKPGKTRHTHWAAESRAAIHPGVMMYTRGAQCTGNFVFTDRAGGVYVGYAAHCAGKGSSTDTNGCTTRSVAPGTAVDFVRGGSLVSGGTRVGRGRLVYSSWRTMRRLGTKAAATCAYNDFALVKVGRGSVGKVNPTVPFWGGPRGIDRDGVSAGDRVWTYGNSSLRAGVSVLSPHTGVTFPDAAGDRGWSHTLYTVGPGIPGDSGSGFMTRGGKAVGVLSTLGLAPLPASNNIGDLAKELRFAQQHSGIPGLRLANGTRGFSPVL